MGDDETPYLLVSASPDNAIDLFLTLEKGRFHYYLRLYNFASLCLQRTIHRHLWFVPWIQVFPCAWKVHHADA